jgi:hypothetical protein
MKRSLAPIATLATLAVLGLAGAVAHSGYKQTNTVLVNDVGREATGSFGSARNSADSNQRIYCWVSTYAPGPSATTGACSAESAGGTEGMCVTQDPALLDAIRAVNSDAFLRFRWDTDGQCTLIQSYNGSLWAPKVN